MENKILPCPFCGGRVEKRESYFGGEELRVMHDYRCFLTYTSGCDTLVYEDGTVEITTTIPPYDGMDEQAAIEAWNTRVEGGNDAD